MSRNKKSTHTPFKLSATQMSRLSAALAIAIIGSVIGLRLSSAGSQPPLQSDGHNHVHDSAVVQSADNTLALDEEAYANSVERPVKRFVTDAARGLHWEGFRENPGGQCGSLLEVYTDKSGFQGCSHGPDPAPAGVDARDPVQPYTSAELASANNIVCEGDGQSGNRVQALYVRAEGTPSNYARFGPSFQEYARRANTLIIESSYRHGQARSIRFVTDSGCKVSVPEVTIPNGSDDLFGDTVAALKQKGYNRVDRKYMVWLDYDYSKDPTPACGWGSVYNDSSPSASNGANKGPTFGLTGNGCWGRGTESHELLHNLGAVQNDAPNTDNSSHCTDEWDRMCQVSDGVTLRYICGVSQQNLFDCNGDDYFNTATNIPSSNYLSNHWNSANNAYFIRGGTPPRDTVKPAVATFPDFKPNDTITGTNRRIAVIATDNVGISKVTFQIDNGPITDQPNTLMLTDGSPSTQYYAVNYDTTKLTNGNHTVNVVSHDLSGNTTASSITLNVQNTTTTPPPTTPPPTTPPPTTPPPTTPPPTTPPKKGDLNSDNKVNITDLSILLSNWGKTGVPADLNNSGKVDITDMSILLSSWG